MDENYKTQHYSGYMERFWPIGVVLAFVEGSVVHKIGGKAASDDI